MDEEGERWYRIDEHTYAVVTAGYAAKRFQEFFEDRDALPWAILAMFNAAQAAMVCHVTGTAGIGALEKKCAADVYDAIQGKGAYPEEKLADFKELLKRTTNENRQIESAGQAIQLGLSDRQALDRLLKLRRDFAHFTPKGWSVEISGLPKIAMAWSRVMRGVQEAGWALRHCEDYERENFKQSVEMVEQIAAQLFRN